MGKYKIQELIELVGKKDRRALAKAITVKKKKKPGWIELLNSFYKKRVSVLYKATFLDFLFSVI